jgi:hypothetical protein
MAMGLQEGRAAGEATAKKMRWRCNWGAAIGGDNDAAGGSNGELEVAVEKLQWSCNNRD